MRKVADNGTRARPGLILGAALFAVVLMAGCTGSGAAPTSGPGSTSPAGPRDSAGTRPSEPGTTRPTSTLPPLPEQTAATPVADLIEQLQTASDPVARILAVQQLIGVTGDPRVGAALEGALADVDVEVRTAAAVGLGARLEAHAIKPLIVALKTEFAADRASPMVAAAATALGQLKAVDAVSQLVTVYVGQVGDGSAAAIAALKAIGSASAIGLAKLLSNADVDVRLLGVDGLTAIGKPGVKSLIAALKNSEVKVRSRAANRLGYLGDRSAEAGLAALLDDPATGGGNSASIALARLYVDAPTSLLHYLTSKATIRIYYGLVFVGADGTQAALASALLKRGDYDMARFFLNCGDETLEQAAHDWAYANGYYVTTVPGSGDGTWGAGLPD